MLKPRLLALTLLALGLDAGASLAALELDSLQGWWHARAVHDGVEADVYLHVATGEKGPVATIGLPDMMLWEAPVGSVKAEGDTVSISGIAWSLRWNAGAQRLEGVLPEALVPVYTIPVSFGRIEPPSRPDATPLAADPLKVAWQASVGAPVWAGLTIDGARGQLLVASDAGAIQALDTLSGKSLWKFETQGRIRARPTVHGDSVFIVSSDGHLYRLRASDGRQVWRAPIDARIASGAPVDDAKKPFDRYSSAATADDERVYVGSRDGSVYAIDLATGRERWRSSVGDTVTSTPRLAQGLLVFGSHDRHVHALDPRTGSQRWKRDVRGAVPNALALEGDTLLAGTRAYELVALDVGTGEPRWDSYMMFSWVESTPAIGEGIAYVGSSDALSLFAYELREGRRVWRTRLHGWAWSEPVLAGDLACIGTVGGGSAQGPRAGGFWCVRRADGEVVVGQPLAREGDAQEWGVAASAASDGRFVYAADLAGKVWSFAIPGAAPAAMERPVSVDASGTRIPADADSAADAEEQEAAGEERREREFVAPGYKKVMRNGQYYYCTYEASLGTRFKKMRCYTPEQMREMTARSKERLREIQGQRPCQEGGTAKC